LRSEEKTHQQVSNLKYTFVTSQVRLVFSKDAYTYFIFYFSFQARNDIYVMEESSKPQFATILSARGNDGRPSGKLILSNHELEQEDKEISF
jgi:hypothetical protein